MNDNSYFHIFLLFPLESLSCNFIFALYFYISLEYFHDTMNLCKVDIDDVSHIEMASLTFVLNELPYVPLIVSIAILFPHHNIRTRQNTSTSNDISQLAEQIMKIYHI